MSPDEVKSLLAMARRDFAEFYTHGNEEEAALLDAFVVLRAGRFLNKQPAVGLVAELCEEVFVSVTEALRGSATFSQLSAEERQRLSTLVEV